MSWSAITVHLIAGLACCCQQWSNSHKWRSRHVRRSFWSTAGRIRHRARGLCPKRWLPQSGRCSCLWCLWTAADRLWWSTGMSTGQAHMLCNAAPSAPEVHHINWLHWSPTLEGSVRFHALQRVLHVHFLSAGIILISGLWAQ